MTDRPRVLLAMHEHIHRQVFDAELMDQLAELAVLVRPGPVQTFTDRAVVDSLGEVDVLLTSWGCPPVDEAVLRSAPRLRAIVHAAGSVKGHVTQACWDRGLVVSTAAAANAVPVAEYTLAAVLFAGKRVPTFAAGYQARPGESAWRDDVPNASNYQRSVGIVGFSRIGRRVAELLRPFDLDVLVADPFAEAGDVAAAGGTLVELDDLVVRSDTVTLHAPALPATYRMIDARRLAMMPDFATLVNTARGSLVDTDALAAECRTGRLSAILDVTDPEPLPAGSPLYGLPNVVLTPHVAGALDGERRRLARLALDELARFAKGEPMHHEVRRSDLENSA